MSCHKSFCLRHLFQTERRYQEQISSEVLHRLACCTNLFISNWRASKRPGGMEQVSRRFLGKLTMETKRNIPLILHMVRTALCISNRRATAPDVGRCWNYKALLLNITLDAPTARCSITTHAAPTQRQYQKALQSMTDQQEERRPDASENRIIYPSTFSFILISIFRKILF